MKQYISLLSACAVLLFAQTENFDKSALLPESPLPMEKSIRHDTLKNGFSYSIVHNARPREQAEIRLYVGAGSLDEAEDQRGLAHFVEHMAFNGIRHFRKNELVRYLESVGMVFGGDLNANTTRERTLYMLSLPLQGDNLEKALTIVRDWADGLNFNPDEYEKERKIILEERRLRDTVGKRLLDQYDHLLYGHSRYLEQDPIGKIDVIEQSSVKQAKAFYDTWYRPEWMHLIVAGDINVTQVEQMIRQKMETIRAKSTKERVLRTFKMPNKTEVLSITDKELSMNTVSLFYNTTLPPMQHTKEKRASLIRSIIFMLIDLKAQEQLLKTNPKAMEIKMFVEPVSQNRLVYEFVASYKTGDALAALEELYRLLASFETYGFTEENVALSKKLIRASVDKAHARVKDTLSKEIAQRLVSTIENNATYIDDDYDYNLTTSLLDAISTEEINKAFKTILHIPSRSILFKDIRGDKFKKEEVLHTLEKARNEALKPKKSIVSSTLIDHTLPKRKIIEKRYDQDLGIYHYLLENHISIDFKPDASDKNLLQLTAYSKGGYSILQGEALKASKVATDIITQSAPGRWTDIEVKKILTGKQVEVYTAIERFSEQIHAACNTNDMESMFALIYARISQPKVDPRVLENIKRMLRNNITQLQHDPQYRFMKEVLSDYYHANPALMPLTIEEVNRLDAQTLLSLYKERFGDMNNFHFAISGDASPKQIETYISRYLGNLPTQKRTETYRAVPYSYPKGEVTVSRAYHTENKANITMQYTSEVPFSLSNNLRVMIASNILAIRLREIIREERSGVYDISVNAELTPELKNEAITTITFVCDPNRKEELLHAVKDTISTLKKNGITQRELETLKKMITLEYKKSIDQNRFWVDSMIASYRFDLPISEIVNVPKILNNITQGEIKKTAQELFNGDLLLMLLLPQKQGQ